MKPYHFTLLVVEGEKWQTRAVFCSLSMAPPSGDGDGAAGGGGLFVKGPLTLSILTFTWEQ